VPYALTSIYEKITSGDLAIFAVKDDVHFLIIDNNQQCYLLPLKQSVKLYFDSIVLSGKQKVRFRLIF